MELSVKIPALLENTRGCEMYVCMRPCVCACVCVCGHACVRVSFWLFSSCHAYLSLMVSSQPCCVQDAVLSCVQLHLLSCVCCPLQFVNPETPGYVGFANLPNQVHRKSVKRGFEFTLMVVGTYISHVVFFLAVVRMRDSKDYSVIKNQYILLV